MDQSIHRSSSWDGRSVYLLHSHTKSLHVFRKSFMYKYVRFTSLRGWFDVTWWSNHGIKTAAHPSSGLLSIFDIKKMSIWACSKSDFHPTTLNCTCQPEYMIDGITISCGQPCAVGRIWPPCVACRSCGTCCRCSHNTHGHGGGTTQEINIHNHDGLPEV